MCASELTAFAVAVDGVLECSVGGGVAVGGGLSSPVGRDSESATTFAFPWMYLKSVVNSDTADSWYACRLVCGSVFFATDGTKLR